MGQLWQKCLADEGHARHIARIICWAWTAPYDRVQTFRKYWVGQVP